MWRALSRIEDLRSKKKYTYCFFLDFSSAYNTVPHQKLFEKLEDILDKEEIQLIKAIYSRTRIALGKKVSGQTLGLLRDL